MTQRTSKTLLERAVQGAHLHPRVERMMLDFVDSLQASLWGANSTQIVPTYLSAAKSARSGPGAIAINSSYCELTTTGVSDAVTLADGTIVGQMLTVHHVTDGGDADITPANFEDGTSINTAAAGDMIQFMWTGTNWKLVANAGVTAIT
jgi:hypothetical protein